MTMSMKSLLLTGIAAAVTLMMAGSASALTINFANITFNGNANVGSQLSVDVQDPGSGQVSFTFYNAVGIASSITDVYFDDGTLLGIATITDSGAGVDFGSPANPANLPGGNDASPPFVTTAGFSADSSMPVMANGVNSAAESLTITFNLLAGQDFADTLGALADGSLRIGLHVQSIGTTGGSDSYVNTVPDGGMTMSLLGMALAGLGVMARRRK